MLGKISSLKGSSSAGTGSLGKWLIHHPSRYLKSCVDLGTPLSGEMRNARLMIGLDDLRGHFQPNQ